MLNPTGTVRNKRTKRKHAQSKIILAINTRISKEQILTTGKNPGVLALALLAVLGTVAGHAGPWMALALVPLTFVLAVPFVVVSRVGWRPGWLLVTLSVYPVLAAMYLFPFVYRAPLMLCDPPTLLYLVFILWVAAPVMEEIGKGTVYYLAPGSWRSGLLVGAGFGLFESLSFQAWYGVEVHLIRFMATALHATTTALWFHGKANGKPWYKIGAVVIHMVFNVFIPYLIGA